LGTKDKKKPASASEPLWKQRRREMRRQEIKRLMWKIGGIALICVVAGLLIWMNIRAISPHNTKKKGKVETMSALGVVKGKRIDTSTGSKKYVISFAVGSWVADKIVDEKTYGKLQKGQEFLVTYEPAPFSGKPKVVKWEPVNYESGGKKNN
jgi:hypothetical protein